MTRPAIANNGNNKLLFARATELPARYETEV